MREIKTRETTTQFHPDKPWLNREDWASGRIKSTGNGVSTAGSIFIFIWAILALLSSLAILLSGMVEDGGELIGALVFLGASIGLLLFLTLRIVRSKKYGKALFDMKSVPGEIGGNLEGTIFIPAQRSFDQGCKVSLLCYKDFKNREGTSPSGNVIWKDEKHVDRISIRTDSQGTHIPVSFSIPDDCPETDADIGFLTVATWSLQGRGKMPGVDFKANFEVPVYRTADRSATPVRKAETSPVEQVMNLIQSSAAKKLGIKTTPRDGVLFILKEAKAPKMIKVVWHSMLFMVLAFFAVKYVLNDASPVLIIIVGLFMLNSLRIVVKHLTSAMLIEIEMGRFKIINRSFPFSKTEEMPLANIREFHVQRDMKYEHLVIYNLVITDVAQRQKVYPLGRIAEADAVKLEDQLKIYAHL